MSIAPGLVAHFVGGVALGILYLGGIWWNACLFAREGRLRTMLLLMAGRFALLGGVLTLVALEGAKPLLATALGILVARLAVMRRIRRAMA